MKDFCIVGSGVAGSTIANLLAKKYSVEIFDKAKGVGGRAANRRYIKNLSFDHGVQYISPKSKIFKKFILRLKKKGIIKEWEGKHIDLTNHDPTNKKIKYIGKKGNNQISKFLLKKIKKRLASPVVKIEFYKKQWKITLKNKEFYYYKNLIFAIPFPQIKTIAKRYLDKKFLKLNIKMEPNLTVMAVFKDCKKNLISSIKFNDNILGWAANENSKKRYKTKLSLWTIQSNEKWAKKKINIYKENKKNTSNQLLSQFMKQTNLKKERLIFNSIHGWKYSYNKNSTKLKSIWYKKYNMGVCGDWFIGPKVENAWESAQNLFKKLN
tara:strand:- start:972 stop:1940 length:969 start_codon:yes stop_codon:yes gene_type:complete